jgi:hypothetical protein
VTESELERIGRELGITVPAEYRELMRARSAELKKYTHQLAGVTWGWFQDTLYLDPSWVIEVNLLERQPDAGVAYQYPGWWHTFFLIEINGSKDDYCLRLDGVPGVWWLGEMAGEEAEFLYESLTGFVEHQIHLYHESRKNQYRLN